MASLNLSTNGASIRSSYQGVVNAPAPPASSSRTYAQWALFSVQAPLLNAFQNTGGQESVLKVEGTGDGELSELIEDFNDGRIQFAFLKVKDPNTGLPKCVLIAWCGGGVPERTKGYFASHLAAAAKVLHGYHVQITARSDADIDPESIVQKVADSSGAKYSAGNNSSLPARAPPPVASKPVFTPTTSAPAGRINPIAAAAAAARGGRNDPDDDGWGVDAPQVTRTQLEKVESAYRPTKVNIEELRRQKPGQPSGFAGGARLESEESDVVKGGYQPVGKVDIAAIRAQAKHTVDDRPTLVKGAYEPVGKVDIAAIKARAQKPANESAESKNLADRSAPFTQSERLTTLPKPKVGNKFGSSTFTGTKAPAPGGSGGLGFTSPTFPNPAPVAGASRTFADEGGKTPAQVWAEKKAKRDGHTGSTVSPPVTSPIKAQSSGSEWKSGYTGKSWAPVQTAGYGRSIQGQNTGESDQQASDQPGSPGGGVAALRDRFKDTQPMAAAIGGRGDASPPPLPGSSRPSGGFALPGLPSRPPPADYEEEDDDGESSPARIAMPVSRSAEPAFEPPQRELVDRTIPAERTEEQFQGASEVADEEDVHNAARGTAAVEQPFGADKGAASQASGAGGNTAVVEYDYEKAEDNEIDLREGETISNVEMVDEDWWHGMNSQGESGLFPSNYVKLVDDGAGAPSAPVPQSAPAPAAPEPATSTGPTATAQFDYEAAEDNELSFNDGDRITGLEFPDEDWWFGHFNGKSGLFPANYVQLDH